MARIEFQIIKVIALASSLVAASVLLAAEGDPFPPTDLTEETLVYVGSQATGEEQGIYAFWLQTKNLAVSQNITLVPIGIAAATPQVTHLELDPDRRLVFALSAVDEFEGKAGGSVAAFAVDAATGKLNPINQQPSMGAEPCHLALDREVKHALVTNCASGNLAVFPIGPDGTLGAATQVVSTGSADSAGGAQTACVALDPENQFGFACETGLGKVLAYRYDVGSGVLAPGESLPLDAGSGPRRMVFRPDGKFAYAANESNSTITAYAYDSQTGSLAPAQTVATVPPYYDGSNRATELAIHPTGRFLYVSNSGHNSVVLFTVNEADGLLTYVEEQGTGGSNPVNFGIQPSAKHLAIANYDADTVLVCRIDDGNGRLKPSGLFADVPSPTIVRFLPPAE
jgi:6-phosphogluconolactonase